MAVSGGALSRARFEVAVRRALPVVVAAVVALGVVLRFRQYAGRRSLWLDELSVALNLGARGFLDLLRPLDYNQTAPLLFLWIQELATRVGGLGEQALRFAPLVCGIALLPVAWEAARRMLEPWAAACAVLLLAVSPLLVWHSNEVKPYAGDALASAAMLLLALRTLETPADPRRWRWLAIGGVVALLGSTPAVFVLGGVALAMVLDSGVRRDGRGLRRALVTGTVWGVTFLAVYLAIYRAVARSRFMQRYWNDDFLRIDASLPGAVWREAAGLLEAAFLPYVDGTPLAAAASVAVVLAGVGAVHAARRQGVARAALLLAPLALALAASLLRRYPLEPRLFLFAVPPLALLLLQGVSALDVPRFPVLRLAGFAALFGFSVVSSTWRLVKAPVHREEARPVLDAYQRKERNEPVLVFGDGMKSWVYYTLDWARPESTRLHWPKEPDRPLRGPDGIVLRGRLPGKRRPLRAGWHISEGHRARRIASPCAWLFFAHYRQPLVDSLLDGIVKAGGSARREAAAPGAELHRACFEPRQAAGLRARPRGSGYAPGSSRRIKSR